MNFKYVKLFFLSLTSILNSQNQLPIQNGQLEATTGASFTNWTNQSNNGAVVNYGITTTDLINGSTKALKSTVTTLGTKGWDVSSSNNYAFEVLAGETYTVSFYAKTETIASAQVKLVFQSEIAGSYQGVNIELSNTWERYHHTFTVDSAADLNEVKLWYLKAGVTYFIDEVSVAPGSYIALDTSTIYQTVDGFGSGIKRMTEHLYALTTAQREQVEAYAFEELEVNMIRFFVYHDLERSDDVWDWTRYESDTNNWKSRYVAEALNNAFSLSTHGFDHVIGNCNSAPGWMKKNGSHKRTSEDEDILLNTLKTGYESEYSAFLVTFLQGMKSRYNIDVTAISPTNEPDFLNTYESMNSTPKELIAILKELETRLDAASLSTVQVISSECGLVAPTTQSNLTTINSTTTFTNDIFSDNLAKNAVDIIGTHTYFDSNHDTNWDNLKTAADSKPVWVTESADLKSTDLSMTDAANYIKWIMRGFNEGGLTAYMSHLYYEEADDVNGTSALVLWDDEGNVILPKRYYIMKHFANLVKSGYQLISSHVVEGNLFVSTFQSADAKTIVVQVFNESGATQDLSIDTPIGIQHTTHFSTSDDVNVEFTVLDDLSFGLEDRYVSFEVPDMSMHSVVYQADTSLSISSHLENNLESKLRLKLFPNPSSDVIYLEFPKRGNYQFEIYDAMGVKVFEEQLRDKKAHTLDIHALQKGIYFLNCFSEVGNKRSTVSFGKQ